MKEDECVALYRMASAHGMRKVADLFRVEKPDTYKYLRELAERTEKGEA